MRPEKFEDFIGQESAKTVCKILVDSAKLNRKSVPHILISSPPGYGKTSLAYIIANEMASRLFIVNCASIRNIQQILSIIVEMNNYDVLFLDECHSLPKRVCEILYTIMEDFEYFDDYGGQIGVSEITILGASTQIGELPDPLKTRFKYNAELIQYTEQEMIDICKLYCSKMRLQLSSDSAKIIAKTVRSTPRIMVNRVEWIHSYVTSQRMSNLCNQQLKKIISLQGVNEDGLERRDIVYLKSLSSYKQGVSQISSKISIDESTIKSTIEPYLIKLGFVSISKGGRALTRNGLQYIKDIEQGVKNSP